MDDAQLYADSLPDWLRVEDATRMEPLRLSPALVRQLPQFAELLASGRSTRVRIRTVGKRKMVTPRDEQRILLAWDAADGETMGWVVVPAEPQGTAITLCPLHGALLREFGGICERFDNEPDTTWLSNQNDALTATLAERPIDEIDQVDLGVPTESQLNFREWYPIADEANGNLTICERSTGEVRLLAHDHAFDHVERVDGWPDYSLYRISGTSSLDAWIETVAKQWLEAINP